MQNDPSTSPAPAGPPTQNVGATVQIVVDTLFARIRAEEYPADARLPSERTLAAELGVARNTVREALDVLESRNIVRRRQGSGSFVTYRRMNVLQTDKENLDSQTQLVGLSLNIRLECCSCLESSDGHDV